jgi:hypothetical protein
LKSDASLSLHFRALDYGKEPAEILDPSHRLPNWQRYWLNEAIWMKAQLERKKRLESPPEDEIPTDPDDVHMGNSAGVLFGGELIIRKPIPREKPSDDIKALAAKAWATPMPAGSGVVVPGA